MRSQRLQQLLHSQQKKKNNMEALFSHLKIWGIVGVTQFTVAMDDFGTEAQIIMHLSAAVASLSIAWWHIFRRGDK